MRLLVELSGEHPALARAEAMAALEASGRAHRVLAAEERLLAVEADVDPAWLGRRLGLAHCVDELLAWGAVRDVLPVAATLDLGDRTFRVRVNSLKGCHEKQALEKQIGDLVSGRVNLSAPDEEVRLIDGENHYLGRRAAVIDRTAFESRKVAKRGFFFPISLHPRYARALVNLARAREGETLLDPFCGTGGVLLEGGLVGARVIGSDIRGDMVEGSRNMLQRWGFALAMYTMDVGDVPDVVDEVDAVATDPPYARSTTTMGEPLASLYARAFGVAAEVLRPGGYVAAIVPGPELARPVEGLRFVESYALRVHKSLTRHFVVMRRVGGG